MKTLLIIGFLLLSFSKGYSQNLFDSSSVCNRLYNEIRNYNQIETKNIGCYGNKSNIYFKVDSLKNFTTSEIFMNYFNDSSYILKYYSFLEILKKNDELALIKFNNIINDTTKLEFDFVGSNRGTINFNELIANEYLKFLKAKYFYGGSVTFQGKSFQFGKKNLKMWKLKSNNLYNLIAKNNLSKGKIEDYSR